MRNKLIWVGLTVALIVPVVLAANSPYLQWRSWVYVVAGFAGILGLCIMLLQPLLAANFLPNLSAVDSRRLHRLTGAFLVLAVVVHVVGLWFTSAPDVVDALLFRSPTPFSVWGVVAMWLVFASAFLAAFRKRLRLLPRIWRIMHVIFAAVIVVGTVVHAVLIEGTMEPISKAVLCGLVILAFLATVMDLRRLKKS